MPPPASPRPDAGDLRGARSTRSRPTSTRRRRRTEPRRAHVPAPEPPRVRARDPRPARARRRRRQLAAARHQERELRQHRRRAGAVADAARGVPQRGERDQPHGGRRSQRAGRRLDLHAAPATCRSIRGITSRARRTARAAASVVEHVFPADARVRLRGRRSYSRRRTRAFEDIDISIDGERVALLEYETRPGRRRRRPRRGADAHRADPRQGRPASRGRGVRAQASKVRTKI